MQALMLAAGMGKRLGKYTQDNTKCMLKSSKEYEKKITEITNDYVYNLGHSGEVGAEYIIKCIQDKISERSKK